MTEQQNPYQAPEAELMTQNTAEGAIALRNEPFAEPIGAGWRWIKEGFNMFKQGGPLGWILLSLVFMILAIVLSIIPFIGSLAMALLGPVFLGGIMLGAREVDNGGQIKVGNLFDGFSKNTGQLVMVGVLYFVLLIVAVIPGGVLIGFGTAMAAETGEMGLLPILGGLVMAALIIPVVMAYWFAPALVALHDKTAWDAMKLSFKGCLKNILPFLWYGIISMVLYIVGIIPLGLGLFVVVPVLMASMYTAYRGIFTED